MEVEILLVEDNASDVDLIMEAFAESKLHLDFTVASDGIEAMNLLKEKVTTQSLPDLILLDLNLPRKSGREVLQEVKAHRELKSVPVIVLTTSSAPEDIAKCYCMSANGYIRKPMGFDQYMRIAKSIEEFWLGVVNLPEKLPCC
jgi:two-component system, chemotaxis family, response regulator Rcp1